MSGSLRRLWILLAVLLTVAAGCLIQSDPIERAQVTTGSEQAASLLSDPTAVPTPVATPTPEPEPTSEPTAVQSASARAEAAPTATVAATPTTRPTAPPAPTARPTVAATVTPAPAADPTATAEPAADPTATAEPTATPDPLDFTSVRDVTCPAGSEDPTITCKIVTLPEDDESPADGRTVELFVSFIDNGDTVGAGPTVILQGGPGVAIASTASDYLTAGLDIVLVDQRGAGLSTPSLDCPEFSGVFETIAQLESRDGAALTAQVDANRECRDRLVADGVRLDAFNSERNADDIALLREVLGYDEWNVYGSSYGTRLALTLLRDHPEGIRAVVLDAVLPLEVDFFGQVPANAERAITALNTACVEAVTCAETYGDLVVLLDQAAERFDESPATIAFTRPTSGEVIDAVIDGPALRSFVFDQMYLDEELAALPKRLRQAADGDVIELAAQVLQRQDPAELDFAEAMYWSVFCADEAAFFDDAADDEVLARQPDSFGVAHASTQVDAVCAVWDVPDAPAVENQAVTSAVPTLLFSGGLDPITPPAWAQLVADALDQTYLVSLPRQSHGASNACVGTILSAFLATPSAAPDASCVDTSPLDFD